MFSIGGGTEEQSMKPDLENVFWNISDNKLCFKDNGKDFSDVHILLQIYYIKVHS